MTMEERNFHTSLFGGFRKKDVVAYLAESRQSQTQELEQLQRQVEELERRLEEIQTESGEDRDRVRQLEEQAAQAHQAQLNAQAETRQARQAQAEAERSLAESEEDRRRLLRQLMELQIEQAAPPPPPAPEDMLSDEPEEDWSDPEEEGLAARMWSLCGKMERTLDQMERIMDGPYQVTCYPDLPKAGKGIPVPGASPYAAPPEPVASVRAEVRGPAQVGRNAGLPEGAKPQSSDPGLVSAMLQRVRQKERR